MAARRCFYQVTLKREWAVEAVPLPKRGETLPVILSPKEVVRSVGGYGASQAPQEPHHVVRRGGEALRLQVADVDSNLMVLRVAQGKGARDRYVMLSPTLLQRLRVWWRVERPARWLFPGRNPEEPMQKGTVQWGVSPRPVSQSAGQAGDAAPAPEAFDRVLHLLKNFGFQGDFCLVGVCPAQLAANADGFFGGDLRRVW